MKYFYLGKLTLFSHYVMVIAIRNKPPSVAVAIIIAI